MPQNLEENIREENENANVELGPITRMVLRILPTFLQRLPFNIEWMHYVFNMARNIGDHPQINLFLNEEQWNQYRIEMDNLIQRLPPRINGIN
jgi:hypothetical protein